MGFFVSHRVFQFFQYIIGIYPSALHSHHYGMNNPLAGATKGVLLITERPTSREDLNRPLKSKITTV